MPRSKLEAQATPVDPASVLRWIEDSGDPKVKDGMARYAIPSDSAVGIPVGVLRDKAKSLGRDHTLAAALWKNGGYEARMLACFVDDPALVTPTQMDRWARDFDNWAICDTACFHLFDRTPHAHARVEAWHDHADEWVKRAAFALLASLALHDKRGDDAPYQAALALVERAATDDRNFVKKAVSWALRGIGKRSPSLRGAATKLATRLAASSSHAARWVGKDALRELAKGARTATDAKTTPRADAPKATRKTTKTKAAPKRKATKVKAKAKAKAKAATAKKRSGRT